MKIQKMLFVTRFEDIRFDDLLPILELRKASLDHVVFLNVIEPEKIALRRGLGYRKDEAVRLRERANVRFIDWAEQLFEQGLEVGVYIVVGPMAQQVVKAAKNEEADLIVMGYHKKSKVQELTEGVDISEIAYRTKAPVLMLKESRDEPTECPFRRPLLATAWSPASNRAIELIESMGSVIETAHVIHAASESSLKAESSMAIQETRKTTRKKLDEICERLSRSGISAKPHVYIGEPAAEIQKAALEFQASMVVLGMSRRAGWQERWLGSVPKRLIETLNVPLLVVPTA
ncbi:universal stress protein [Desulfatirhabdium butyrativorans]|uniref:universal stress protein n=1 Tax=Desulfatirhabdium butyrativorans TaxID=340467 RepID=UPI0003FA134A|nr:universal stress protein [Desulfatirhabdium butyrativorans]